MEVIDKIFAPTTKSLFFDDVKLRLGKGVFDIELTENHYEFALRYAILKWNETKLRKTVKKLRNSFVTCDENLLNNPISKLWVFDYVVLQCKTIILECRSKFNSEDLSIDGLGILAESICDETVRLNVEIEQLVKEI